MPDAILKDSAGPTSESPTAAKSALNNTTSGQSSPLESTRNKPMKPILILLALAATSYSQTLYGYIDGAELRLQIDPSTPWVGTLTVDNTLSETLTFAHSSNLAPYTAGYSTASPGGFSVVAGASHTETLYTWGVIPDHVIVYSRAGESHALPMSYTQNVPEPTTLLLGAVGMAFLVGRRRK